MKMGKQKSKRGGKRPGAGRPKISVDKRKTVMVAFRVSVDEWDLLERAAKQLEAGGGRAICDGRTP